MPDSTVFRWFVLGTLLAVVTISGYYRRRARAESGTIPRQREGLALIVARLAFALPLFLSVIIYVLNPDWMAWSSLSLPTGVRRVGVGLGLLAVPGAFWVFRSIGANISETVLTKEHHVLITHGPYRWVRHPLYTLGILLFVAFGLMAANWFILAVTAVSLAAIVIVVIPREEKQLRARFGDEYRDYMAATSRMVPGLRRGRE